MSEEQKPLDPAAATTPQQQMAAQQAPKSLIPKHLQKQDGKQYASRVELGLGSSFLASKTTMDEAAGSLLEITSLGVRATSKEGRVVLVPWSNIRCVDLIPSARMIAKAKSRKK